MTIELLVPYGSGKYFVNSKTMMPTRAHQMEDDLMRLKRDFAGEIYYQRCLEKCL